MRSRACKLGLAVTIVTLLAGCNQGVGTASKTKPATQTKPQTQEASAAVSAAAIPALKDGSLSDEAKLKRFRGQTEFLTALPYSPMMARAATLESAKGGGGPRQEQEADIFKVGKPGSKLLFLLNNYRGLQVVSFANGADKPELLGRVKATGNYPKDMYYDDKNDRLLVLERLYYKDDGTWNYSEEQSRLLVYDVANPSKPSLKAEVAIKGEVGDSRIVGNVLYVASSLRPDQNDSRNTRAKGLMTSFNISKSEITEVAAYELALPAVRGELMNIQTIKGADGSYKYYLVAVLSETGWGWWDRKSLIEVVDISDENGKITPVMTVSAKGRISKRSQTAIFGSTLVATSNYEVEGEKNSQGGILARIAVETFNLPQADTQYLTERQAQIRQLQIAEDLQGKSGEEYDKALEILLGDEKSGLRGRFMKTADNRVRKLVADSVDTRGDTTGMSTSLQDVRYQNGLLYAFWVPSNNIDPLDIFDISAPEKGVKYLSRLQFEGWISRSEPFMVGERRFILGLGWIVPSDSTRGLARPQAMIFEITKHGEKYKATEVAQATFADGKIGADFNAADKYIEIRADANGVGQVLFSASRWSENSYESGGKILNFDISKVVNGKPEEALKEGVFLAGNSGWLRRVFTNSEIDRVNTFSDKALGVFNTAEVTQDKTVKAVAVLELARQVQSYEAVTLADKTYGLQVISDWSWYGSEKSQTSLRLVESKQADAELPAVLTQVTLPGVYEDSEVDQNGRIYVLTREYIETPVKDKPGHTAHKTMQYLHIVTPKTGEKLALYVNSQSWEVTEKSYSREVILVGGRRHYGSQLVKLADGNILMRVEGEVRLINSKSTTAAVLALKGCTTKDRQDVKIRLLNDRLVLTSSEMVKLGKAVNEQALKNFMALATLSDSTLTCEAEVNIPGQLLTISAEGSVVTDDLWVMDIVDRTETWKDGDGKDAKREYREYKTTRSLTGLAVRDGKATLIDQMDNKDGGYDSRAVSLQPGQLITVSNFADSRMGGGMPFYRGRGRPYYRESRVEPALEFVQVDAQGLLTKEQYAIPLAAGSNADLMGVEKDPRAKDQYLALLRRGQIVQVVRWSQAARRPQLVKLVPLNEKLETLAEVDSVRVADRYLSYGAKVYNFTPSQLSFELLGGLSGIDQVFVK